MTEPRITLIAGPTASGKSALALARAQATGAVILNADSQQLYADLRVLTARPSVEDEALAEHRLYGVADAADAWSVGRWSRAVLTEIEAQAGRPILIVGGTGLYFTALTRGLAEIPEVPTSARLEAAAEFDHDGEAEFRRRLAEADPESAARITRGDRQRLIRARAVHAHTGRALTAWISDTAPLLPEGSWSGFIIDPPRSELYARCDARVETMVRQGAVSEVDALLQRDLDPALPAMKAVGVREIVSHLHGGLSREALIADIGRATRQYAKRQLTYFRNQFASWPRLSLSHVP